jgi:hypothetical protein
MPVDKHGHNEAGKIKDDTVINERASPPTRSRGHRGRNLIAKNSLTLPTQFLVISLHASRTVQDFNRIIPVMGVMINPKHGMVQNYVKLVQPQSILCLSPGFRLGDWFQSQRKI